MSKSKTKMKLFRKDFAIGKDEIHLLPTIRLKWNDMIYTRKNFAICFHFLCFNARLLFMEEVQYE